MNTRKIVAKIARYSIVTLIFVPIMIFSGLQILARKADNKLTRLGESMLGVAHNISNAITKWEENTPETTFNILKNK